MKTDLFKRWGQKSTAAHVRSGSVDPPVSHTLVSCPLAHNASMMLEIPPPLASMVMLKSVRPGRVFPVDAKLDVRMNNLPWTDVSDHKKFQHGSALAAIAGACSQTQAQPGGLRIKTEVLRPALQATQESSYKVQVSMATNTRSACALGRGMQNRFPARTAPGILPNLCEKLCHLRTMLQS